MSERETGVTAPPFHPWCRCVTAPYYEDLEGIGDRFARDENGEVYSVPKNMSYEEWKAQQDARRKESDTEGKLTKNIELPVEMKTGTEISEDIKAEIKKTIEEVESAYDVRIDEIAYKDISTQGKIPLQFNPINDNGKFKSQFIVNSGYDWNPTLDELNDRIYNKNHITRKLSSRNASDLIYHEMAHFMTFQKCESWSDYLQMEREVRRKYISGISLYNDLKEDGAETIAEGFVALRNGSSISPRIKQLVEQYVLRYKK